MARCFVCGFDLGDFDPWGAAGDEPSRDICPCCGTEFGYEDCTRYSALLARRRWIDDGFRWHSRLDGPPVDWDPRAQLALCPLFVDYGSDGLPVTDERNGRVARRVVGPLCE